MDMPTCNLLEIMHNIQFQQSRTKGAYLYVSNKQYCIYYFKKGGPSS
jgi:hypothetical protein